MIPVESPTVIIGKTQSGKTYRASRLFEATEPPVIFCDIQWRRYAKGIVCHSVKEIVDVLHANPKSRIWWLLNNYDELDELVDYLYEVHKYYNLKGAQIPRLVIFLDEVHRVGDRWSEMGAGANKLFAECFQHKITPVAITQWASHMHKLILTNAYVMYIFSLGDHDQGILRKNYGIDLPEDGWIDKPTDYHYYIYDHIDFKKYDAQGQLVGTEKEEPEEEEEGDKDDSDEDMPQVPQEEREEDVPGSVEEGLSENP